MKKIIMLLICLLLLTGCGKDKKKDIVVVDNSEDNKKVEVISLVDVLSFEINSDAKIGDAIKDDNGKEILNADTKIDTSVLGEQKLEIKYIDGKYEKKYSFTINIIDTQKPVIEYTNELTTSIGNEIDLLSGVKVTDNSNEVINATVEGDYSFSESGVYQLKYVAVDSSGNKAEESFTLIVKTLSIGVVVTPTTEGGSEVEPPVEEVHTMDECLISATHAYKLNYTYGYVKSTNDFIARSRQDILNIVYSAMNEGADKFKFYCSYDNCIEDFKTIGNDGTVAVVQDYVHPYNTYVSYNYQFIGNTVNITGVKRYSIEDITNLENKVNEVMESVNNSMISIDKVRTLHDYLVNNTVNELTGTDLPLHTAVGPLINGRSVCEGYTHAMSIFLYRLGLPNYRVSVPGLHTWNLVYINGAWLHIDVTWDDPEAEDANGDRIEILRHQYFLISGTTIKKSDTNGEHNFDKNLYMEA